MDGYGNLIAARLRKLAVARSTGMLPFSGDNDGAIYFKDGKIVFAESKRTPGPAIPEGLNPMPRGLASPAPADPAEAAEAASPPPFSKLSTLLMVTEPTVVPLSGKRQQRERILRGGHIPWPMSQSSRGGLGGCARAGRLSPSLGP